MLPPKVAENEEDDCTPKEWQFLYELQQFGHPLGNMPLITMIGMREAEDRPGSMSEEQWHTLHQEKIEQKRAFQTLSTNSKVVEVHDAGHSIHLEDPDAVGNAIHEMMNAGFHHARLKQWSASRMPCFCSWLTTNVPNNLMTADLRIMDCGHSARFAFEHIWRKLPTAVSHYVGS